MKYKSHFFFLENHFITIETANRNLFYSLPNSSSMIFCKYWWINNYPVSCSFSTDDRIFHQFIQGMTECICYNCSFSSLKEHVINIKFFFIWHNSHQWARVSSFMRFLDHTWHTTVGRTPLDELLAHHRDLYLTTHNTHDRHPFPWWDSNPQSQQVSGHRATP